MHALFAATGAAITRYDRFVEAAKRTGGWMLHEVRSPSIRLGVCTSGGGVVAAAASGRSHVIALGSGVFAEGADAVSGWLTAFEHSPGRFIDEAPDDVVAIAMDQVDEHLYYGTGRGQHRLFIVEIDGGRLVCSSLTLLTAAVGSQLRLDRTYEDFYLGFGFFPDGRTPYAGLRAQPAGSVASWPEGSTRRIKSAVEVDEPVVGDVQRRLHDAFFTALESQAGGHRRHAVLLGGFDSALVAAGLRQLGHDVDTYTFGFDDPQYEQRHAAWFASEIGARHSTVPITPEAIAADLDRLPDVLNQPGAQPHYQLHTIQTCRLIAQDGHNHVFSGDGCDAAFLGYPTVSRRAALVDRLSFLPAAARRALLGLFSVSMVEGRLGHVARMARSTLRSLGLPRPARGHLPSQYLDAVAIARLRCDSPHQAESIEQIRRRLANGLDAFDPVRLAFHGNALTGQSRAKVEGAVALTGLAQFSPYHHPEVRRIARNLPLASLRPSGSSPGGAGKAILIDMVRSRKLLPERILTMPKQSPSDSPIDHWYAGPLRPLVLRLCSQLPFACNGQYIDELLRPKLAERYYRDRVSISHHALQAVGILCAYGAFSARARCSSA